MLNRVIIWSEKSLETFEEIGLFILEKWNYKVVKQFDKDVDNLLEKLKRSPKLCPKSKVSVFRKCVISSQTSLVYKASKNKIELVSFIDNRSEHKF